MEARSFSDVIDDSLRLMEEQNAVREAIVIKNGNISIHARSMVYEIPLEECEAWKARWNGFAICLKKTGLPKQCCGV